MSSDDARQQLQSLCEQGQDALERTDYLRAELHLVEADRLATRLEDFDTLARLYMPLQEARRQRRQRCGEGIVQLDLIATSADDVPNIDQIVADNPNGQFLIAGWGTAAPAAQARRLWDERRQYAEALLAASLLTRDELAVVIVPFGDVNLPPIEVTSRLSFDALKSQVPHYCHVLRATELPRGQRRGTWQTYAEVMALWECLHQPFLKAADDGVEPLSKIEGYRRTIEVDYACELAHQKLSAVAHQIARERRNSPVQAPSGSSGRSS